MGIYLRPAVLVVDEIGYTQFNRHEAEMFFRLVSELYEHGSIILTSNKYFSDWGELLSDTVIATALLDRLLHHAHVIYHPWSDLQTQRSSQIGYPNSSFLRHSHDSLTGDTVSGVDRMSPLAYRKACGY